MARFALIRLLQAVPTLVLMSIGLFALLRVIPADAADVAAGPDASPETIAAIRADLALDQPIPLQYLRWAERLARGDLGRSTLARRPVADLIGFAFPATMELTVCAMVVALLAGGSLGVASALTRGRLADHLLGAASSLLIGVPSFWLALLAIIAFSLILGWLPPGGRVDPFQDVGEGARSLLLPALVLGVGRAAVLARFTRASMLEVLAQGYVMTARGKGLVRRRIIGHHALRNALIPVVTVVGIEIGHLLGGALVIESVFAWPGLGRLLLSAVTGRDYAVVQAVVLVLAGIFVLVNFVTDVVCGILDPRLRAVQSAGAWR